MGLDDEPFKVSRMTLLTAARFKRRERMTPFLIAPVVAILLAKYWGAAVTLSDERGQWMTGLKVGD